MSEQERPEDLEPQGLDDIKGGARDVLGDVRESVQDGVEDVRDELKRPEPPA